MKPLNLHNLKYIILLLFYSSCVTTNYYTGRTLEKGKVVLTPGIDNVVLITEKGKTLDKNFPFSISLGAAVGLPWRFETGIRAYFPFIYELNLRHQINPRAFKWFDLSMNFHSGIMFSYGFKDVSSPYYKYGLTISKEVYHLQPYLSYYLNNNYLFEIDTDSRYDYSIVCFGLAIPYKGDLIFPEVNYFKNNEGFKGYYTFGIGLRVHLEK